MGVMSAAVGTLCARLVEFAVCVFYLLKVEKKLDYRFSGILTPPNIEILKEFRRYGLPVIISDTILGLSSSVISMILGHMGKEITSAYSIVVVLDRACSVVTMGTANAAGIMVGQTVGKGDIPRARKGGETFLAISIVMGLLGSLLVATLGVLSIGFYNISPSTYSITLSMMYASAIVMVFRTIQSYLGKGILRGAGDTNFLMVADVLFQWCASIPLGYIFGILLNAPPFWVLLFIQIDYIIKAVWFTFRLYGGKWIHQVGNASK